MINIIVCLLSVIFGVTWASGAENFEDAKRIARIIWNENRETFYCGCGYSKKGIIDFAKCEYQPKNKHAKRIGWEHVVPASWYGKTLPCWSNSNCIDKQGKKLKGRKCCQKTDNAFRQMEADLHNLVPVIREVNLARLNYHFGEFYAEDKRDKYRFRHCDLIIDEYYRILEPRDAVKGMVARIHFYMASKYGIRLSERQKRLMAAWNKKYPPTDWENRWHRKVAAIQGDNFEHIWKGQVIEKGDDST